MTLDKKLIEEELTVLGNYLTSLFLEKRSTYKRFQVPGGITQSKLTLKELTEDYRVAKKECEKNKELQKIYDKSRKKLASQVVEILEDSVKTIPSGPTLDGMYVFLNEAKYEFIFSKQKKYIPILDKHEIVPLYAIKCYRNKYATVPDVKFYILPSYEKEILLDFYVPSSYNDFEPKKKRINFSNVKLSVYKGKKITQAIDYLLRAKFEKNPYGFKDERVASKFKVEALDILDLMHELGRVVNIALEYAKLKDAKEKLEFETHPLAKIEVGHIAE